MNGASPREEKQFEDDEKEVEDQEKAVDGEAHWRAGGGGKFKRRIRRITG